MIWRRIFMDLRRISFYSLVPLIFLNIISPIIYSLIAKDADDADVVLFLIGSVYPFFSVWWLIFLSRELVEADGNELFYVPRTRSMILEQIILFSFYQINVFVLFLLMSVKFPGILLNYPNLLCSCVMFFGAAYFLLYITGSIVPAIMVSMIYSLFYFLNCAFSTGNLDIFLHTELCLYQLILGLILFVAGYVSEQRYTKFN